MAGWRVWALPVWTGLSVVAFACGSSSIASLKHAAHNGRWLVLFALLGLALVEALPVVREKGISRGLLIFGSVASAFAALAVLSAAWSATPRLTFERGVSVCVLFAVAAAIAAAIDGDPVARRRLFVGLAAGAGVVAIVGLLMLAIGVDAAAQKASHVTPWRFRGFGENPNTIPVLGAVALPIVTWLWLTTGRRVPRALWVATFACLLATTLATQSRGGLIGAFVGVTLVLALLVQNWPRKIAAIAAFGAVIAGGVILRQATQPPPPAFYSAVKPPPAAVRVAPSKPTARSAHTTPHPTRHFPPTPGHGTVPALPARHYRTTELPPRTSEIGFPTLSRAGVTDLASGRVAAWEGALKLVKDQPLLGYGFGTEASVFVDRWYYFESALPENSTIGLLLQLGIVGLAIAIGMLVLLVRGATRALRSGDAEQRGIAIVGLGVVGGAVAVTFIQSYIYSVGNVASATFWITAFLLAAAVVSQPAHARP